MSAPPMSTYRIRARRSVADSRGALPATVLVLYAHLWVIEGALRKWVPGADRPFYVARDAFAVAVLVFVVAVAKRASSREMALGLSLLAGFVAYVLLSALASPTSLAIAFAGTRSYVAPAIAILLGVLADPSVGRRVLRALLVWAPLNALLAAVQSRSPIDAFVNRQASGDSAQFEQFGAVRASGTFTAPSGLTIYAIAAAAAALIFVLRPADASDRRWGIAGVISTVGIVALGGSRGALLGVAVVAIFTMWRAVVAGRTLRAKHVVSLVGAIAIGLAASRLLFPSVLASFAERIANAAQSEDTTGRLVAQLTSFPRYLTSALGDGPGVHSQAGIALGSIQDWIEDDSSKFVAELGIVGVALATARLLLVVLCLVVPFARPNRFSLEVSVLMAALGMQQLVGGITQNPTAQGGFALSVIVLLAAVRVDRQASGAVGGEPEEVSSAPRRGVSSFRTL